MVGGDAGLVEESKVMGDWSVVYGPSIGANILLPNVCMMGSLRLSFLPSLSLHSPDPDPLLLDVSFPRLDLFLSLLLTSSSCAV